MHSPSLQLNSLSLRNLSTTNYWKKFLIIGCSLYFSLVFLLIFSFLSLEYIHKKNLATALKDAIYNPFSYGDLRTVTMILGPNIPSEFSKIKIGHLYQWSDQNPSSLNFSFSLPLLPQKKILVMFYWDIMPSLLWCLSLSGIILLLLIPIAKYFLKFRFKQIEKKHQLDLELQKVQTLQKISTQVAHDIRSPLTVLQMITRNLSHIPEEERMMIRDSVTRIHDIANDLLNRYTHKKDIAEQIIEEHQSLQFIPGLLDSIITEKRMQYKSKRSLELQYSFQNDPFDFFSQVNPAHFKRMFSNLINNSVEAMEFPKEQNISPHLQHQKNEQIHIQCYSTNHFIQIEISDNGKGMTEDQMSQMGINHFTYGKKNGHGQGFSHALETIKTWKGSLAISSKQNEGTIITLLLPKSDPPNWFLSYLKIPIQAYFLILDDDPFIHHIWDKKLKSFHQNYQTHVIHFYKQEDFFEWKKMTTLPSSVHLFYLFDYELSGSMTTGLDLLIDQVQDDHKVQKHTNQSYLLITSRHEELPIQNLCSKHHIYLVPKFYTEFLPLLPIEEKKVDCILIDDDELLRLVWKKTANSRGIHLDIFSSPEHFLDMHYSKDTKIFLDHDLGPQQENGIYWGKKFFNEGFTNLYLTTGHDPSQMSYPWFKQVVGKMAPWMN